VSLANIGQFISDTIVMLDLTEHQLRWIQVIVAAVAFISSAGIIRYVVRWYEFRRRVFFNQMVISVNIIDKDCFGGKWRFFLKLRTLIEDQMCNILDNSILVGLVQKAAKACTEENPILELTDPEDHALLLTKLQNAISHFFAREYMQIVSHSGQWEFLYPQFCVTCEQYGGIKATKVRVLVYMREAIDLLASLDPETVKLESPHHSDRIRTLVHIAQNQVSKHAVFGTVEIPVRR
jgi:hypothetical protein